MVPMEGSALSFYAPDGHERRAAEVRLRRTWYRYETIRVHEDRLLRRSGELACYELETGEAYTWAHCFGPPMPLPTRFALFSLDDGTSYLCWPSAHRVKIADVTRPRDRIVAFQEYFNGQMPPGPPEVFVSRLVPGAGQWGGPLLQQDPDAVRILALERDADGALLLTVKDSTSPAAAVLVLRDGEWGLLHDYPDGLPEAPPSQPEPGDPDEAR
jgi:hypothetical protein